MCQFVDFSCCFAPFETLTAEEESAFLEVGT